MRIEGVISSRGPSRPYHVHQWRHTFATTLVNRGVRLEVVKQLLDHASIEMASHDARLLDTTIRAEWDAARDSDGDLQHLLPADVSAPTSTIRTRRGCEDS